MSEWQTIDTAPMNTTKMYVVIAVGVKIGTTPYTTDPWCVWHQNNTFVRWPHHFPPTHWMQLPEPPK